MLNHHAQAHIAAVAGDAPFYDWMALEANATRAWYPADIPAALPPGEWLGGSGADCRFVNAAGTARTLASFNGRAGLLFDGTAHNTSQDLIGNPLTFANLMGSVTGDWCIMAAALPTAVPTITAPDPVTGIGGLPYNAAMVLADSNFRFGLGFASWDPGGGARVYALSFIFNGASFVSSWVDLGASLSPTGYIITSQKVAAGGGTLTTSVQGATGNSPTTGNMGSGSLFVWSGRGGTGFGDNRFTGQIGGVFAKSNSAFPATAESAFQAYWNIP